LTTLGLSEVLGCDQIYRLAVQNTMNVTWHLDFHAIRSHDAPVVFSSLTVWSTHGKQENHW
jgi:hypothetical protein